MKSAFINLFLVSVICWSCSKTSPNIILIVTDDQGYGDVGFHGNTIVKTPRLDAFTEESIELTNFHTGTTCTPTRAGIMTGRNCNRNGAWHTIAGASILNADEQTMAEVFQSAGYQTAMFGKWHLGDNYPYRPHDRGFDEAFYHGGGGVQQTPDAWNNDYFDDTYFRNGQPEKTTGYCTDVWFDELQKFISRNKEKPFFAYLATNAAHGPFNVPEEYRKLYENSPLTTSQKNFYGMVTNLDENFGKLVDFLKGNGLFDNTILIYTTDNGTARGIQYVKDEQKSYGFNPLRGTKGSHYDGGHRVPFLMSWPSGSLDSGLKINELVAHVDLLPSLSALASIPFEPKKPLDGADLSKVIKGSPTAQSRMLVVDTQRKQWPEKYKSPCVMDGPWRLVNNKELYNTETDLAQTKDLATDYPDRVKKMQDFYEAWWTSTEVDWKHSPIHIGSDQENPVLITIHDMHPENNGPIPWNQNQIRGGKVHTKGYFDVNITQPGKYEFQLSRWPRESGLALSDAVPEIPGTAYREELIKGQSLEFTRAYVSLGDVTDSVEVNNQATAASIQVELVGQQTTLEAWFMTSEGSYSPAYYILAERQ